LPGIELSSSQVRRILRRKKYSYIWAKYDLGDKQNPAERALFQERLSEYLAVARDYPELLQVWFWDESGFSLHVIRRKNWGYIGQRKNITGQRRRGRVNVMGAMRESDRSSSMFLY
jgi:hypothetical protein